MIAPGAILRMITVASAQITPSRYKRESIVPCLQALEMIPIRQLLNLALPPWGREGHFFPSNNYSVFISPKLVQTSPPRPRGNSLWSWTLPDLGVSIRSTQDWVELMPAVQRALNTAFRERYGCTPYHVMFGIAPHTALSTLASSTRQDWQVDVSDDKALRKKVQSVGEVQSQLPWISCRQNTVSSVRPRVGRYCRILPSASTS